MLHEAGALHDVLHLHDVLSRVSLGRLCHTLCRARSLDGMCNIAITLKLLIFFQMFFPWDYAYMAYMKITFIQRFLSLNLSSLLSSINFSLILATGFVLRQ